MIFLEFTQETSIFFEKISAYGSNVRCRELRVYVLLNMDSTFNMSWFTFG